VDRIRARVRASLGPGVADRIPDGYQRMGSVVRVRLDDELRPHYAAIGTAYQHEIGVAAVMRISGATAGEYRSPSVERIAGDSTITEVHENGVRYRFDAARTMFASGNRTERLRAASLTRPGDRVADLFAGIGYFTLPIAVHARPRQVTACELNPLAFDYLVQNVELNHVEPKVRPMLGDNRTVPLPRGEFDRVFLGYLPSAVPWVPRALELLDASGGWLHVHLVVGAREGASTAEGWVREAVIRAGGSVRASSAREVKPYGPGRLHAVVDVHAVSG
jgi:tRNA wybutosine-synthesizing protein 2